VAGGWIGLALAGAAVAAAQSDPPVLVGAGDIAVCGAHSHHATAALLDSIPGTVFTAGDHAYRDGTVREFLECYEPSWGRHKARTRPAPGNHDYRRNARGYFGYFGARAGDPELGYYSYDLGAWHIVVLNSNVRMEAGSPQEQWLRRDLAAHPRRCTLAIWHRPRFSSGAKHGPSTQPQDLWRALAEAGAEVVINGHEHLYERFAPQTADGVADPRGIRQFTVGTGGAGLYPFGPPAANSEVRDGSTFGVLKLTLHPESYEWEFVPAAGGSFRDAGRAECH
jgi:hypothetical protein